MTHKTPDQLARGDRILLDGRTSTVHSCVFSSAYGWRLNAVAVDGERISLHVHVADHFELV
ncbi:hypothetical protein [Gordonia zhaorongruii]|uniref:hypothetical protein n=1 Tax=Gordonia zhaorongruii TaxID=2597659 RepID=UPI0010452EAE|nr:hypothetical protein [Gordonia zhaorongruii]